MNPTVASRTELHSRPQLFLFIRRRAGCRRQRATREALAKQDCINSIECARSSVLVDVGERAAIGADQGHIAWISYRGLLEDGYGLSALVCCAQCTGVSDGRIGIIWILAMPGTQSVERAPPLSFVGRRLGGDRGRVIA